MATTWRLWRWRESIGHRARFGLLIALKLRGAQVLSCRFPGNAKCACNRLHGASVLVFGKHDLSKYSQVIHNQSFAYQAAKRVAE